MHSILVIDPDETPGEWLRQIRSSCEVTLCRSAAEAVSEVSRNCFDALVVLSPGQPEAGLEICQSLFSQASPIEAPLILVGETEETLSELGAGRVDFCLDPGHWVWDFPRTVTQLSRLKKRFGTILEENQSLRRQQAAHSGLLQKMVHDMKSPLTAMLIELGMLGRWFESANSEKFERSGRRLKENCDELLNLVQNFLDSERLNQGTVQLKMGPLQPIHLLRTVVEELSPRASRQGVDLEISLPSATPNSFSGDATMLARAFSNLLKCLLRLCPAGEKISLLPLPGEGLLRITIRVPVPGLTADAVQGLLDPFAHARWRQIGLDTNLGIGLNLCKLIIEEHRGRFSLESSPEAGLSVLLELPEDGAGRLEPEN